MNTDIEFYVSTPTDDLGYLIWQLTMQWQRQSNKVLGEVGLTHTQYVIMGGLAWLSRSSEQVTQKDIANLIKMDTILVSKVLKKLQQQGVITRQEHPIDARAKCVFLTEKGTEKLQQAINVKRPTNDVFIEKLTNKAEFIRQLQQIVD